MRTSTKIWLVCLSALLTAIAFPPYRTGFLIFFSPILLLIALEDTSLKKAFIIGYIWGLVFNLGTLYGVFWATIPGTFGMLAVISLIPALNALAYRFISVRSRAMGYIIWPLIWVSWDYLRTLTELNFPWGDYGYTLSYYLPMIQPAEILGVYGVSLMIHIVNILLFIAIRNDHSRKFRTISLAAAIVLPMIFLIYGWFRLPVDYQKGNLKIALIQGNITREIKWAPGGREFSFDRYLEMTDEAIKKGVDFIIWPETATPFYLMHKPMYLRRVQEIVDSAKVSILTGTPQYVTVGMGEYVYFNAAALITPHADSIPIYEKIKLVPMSERIPFSGRFKVLKEIRLGQADFSSGRYERVFSLGETSFSTGICFESAFPGYIADFCRKGAEFLVVITNDMWFGPSSLPYQHAQMSVFRAIENRVPVARCANTGISMFIDKWGRISGETKMMQEAIVYGAIHPEKSKSIYNALGNVLPLLCVLASVIMIISFAIFKRGKYNEIHEN
jgi:apolipoprotein N-acyltransferase